MIAEAVKGVDVQARVVKAVILRELRTRFGAYHLGYLWAVIVPLLFILVLTVVYAAIGRRAAHGAPIEVLLLSGMMMWLTFVDTQAHASTAFRSNRPLLVYPMVRVVDIVIARAILEFAAKTCAALILLLIFFVAGRPAGMDDPLGVILGALAACYLGMMYGHIVGCALAFAPSVQFVVTTMRRVLFFTSGALFLLSDVPDEWRVYVLFNPIAHIIDLTRGAWIGSYSAPYGDVGYVAAWAIGLTAVAAVAEIVAEPKRRGAMQ